SVRLDDVAVEPDRVLAELAEVVGRAQRATDEALDLHGTASLAAGPRLPGGALSGRGGQHPVLGRHPAAAAAGKPARHPFLDAGRAQDARLPEGDEHRAVRLLDEVRDDVDRPQLIGPPALPHQAAANSRSRIATSSTSASGSCRNRSPRARNSSTVPVVRKRELPSRAGSFSIPFRSSVSATSRAVSTAEKISVVLRPKTRSKTGLMSG